MFHNNNINDQKAVSTPKPCQEDIFNNGHTVFVLSGWKKDKIEEWVKEVASNSGEKVDWHYSGGRANILGLGDLEKIRNTIKEMLPALNKQINEYYKNKDGFFQPINYTTKDVDCWNNKVKRTYFAQSIMRHSCDKSCDNLVTLLRYRVTGVY